MRFALAGGPKFLWLRLGQQTRAAGADLLWRMKMERNMRAAGKEAAEISWVGGAVDGSLR